MGGRQPVIDTEGTVGTVTLKKKKVLPVAREEESADWPG